MKDLSVAVVSACGSSSSLLLFSSPDTQLSKYISGVRCGHWLHAQAEENQSEPQTVSWHLHLQIFQHIKLMTLQIFMRSSYIFHNIRKHFFPANTIGFKLSSQETVLYKSHRHYLHFFPLYIALNHNNIFWRQRSRTYIIRENQTYPTMFKSSLYIRAVLSDSRCKP